VAKGAPLPDSDAFGRFVVGLGGENVGVCRVTHRIWVMDYTGEVFLDLDSTSEGVGVAYPNR